MAFATAQELFAARTKGGYYTYSASSLAAAEQYIKDALAKALDNKQGCKHDRPWNIVDMTKLLDVKQAWIGFEFETGFDDKAEYQKFINFLWGLDHVAIDREGTGNFPVEVAYPPQTVDDILKGQGMLHASLKFIEANKLTPALNPTTFTRRDVGIHFGISTSRSRKLKGARYQSGTGLYELSDRLSNILATLGQKQMDECYGRHQQHWGFCTPRDTYIEFKMCRAIPTLAHVQQLERVAVKCAELMDLLIDNPKLTKVTNLYEVFSGKAESFSY